MCVCVCCVLFVGWRVREFYWKDTGKTHSFGATHSRTQRTAVLSQGKLVGLRADPDEQILDATKKFNLASYSFNIFPPFPISFPFHYVYFLCCLRFQVFSICSNTLSAKWRNGNEFDFSSWQSLTSAIQPDKVTDETPSHGAAALFQATNRVWCETRHKN